MWSTTVYFDQRKGDMMSIERLRTELIEIEDYLSHLTAASAESDLIREVELALEQVEEQYFEAIDLEVQNEMDDLDRLLEGELPSFISEDEDFS
jgi:hypothetical protein